MRELPTRPKKLVKYVLVTDGGNWLEMDSIFNVIQAAARRTPGTHVERWTYEELPDGSHGEPVKERLGRV